MIMDNIAGLSAEIAQRKVILAHEGWSFSKANYGNLEYWRAAKDGWVSVLDWQNPSEEDAIKKAWERRQEVIDAQATVMHWMKRYPNYAGITYDDIDDKYIATLFVKGAEPKEAKGNSPLLAVERWLELWDK